MVFRALLLFCSLVLSPVALFGEIQWVSIGWTPGQCTPQCAQNLETALTGIPAISSVEMNASAGQAKLYWKVNQPYSYQVLQFAVAKVGIAIRKDEMVTKVHGTLSHDSNHVYLNSIGDNTRFILLGQAVVDPYRPTTRGNAASYPLSPEQQIKLAQAEAMGKAVTVEGQIFMYWRMPLYLIINKIDYGKE